MDDKKKKGKAPGKPKRDLNSVRVREDFSMDEIQKMLGDIDDVLSAHKADQKGIDPENMVKTVRGGRVIWITKEEMNATLAKRRKISGAKYVKRSVRGENNLSSEINRRVDVCRKLIHVIKQAVPDMTAELTRRMRDLDVVHNRSISLARDIRLLETAIQRKKKEDPIISEMENATSDMMNALEKNSLSDVDMSQSFCDEHMEEYHAKQKRLEPYIKKAKDCRLRFLRAKQQIFQFEFDLLENGKDVIAEQIQKIVHRDKEGEVSESLVGMVEEIQSLLSKGKPRFQNLEGFADKELEDQDDLFVQLEKDYLTPLFDQFVCLIESFEKAWMQFVKHKPKETGRDQKTFYPAEEEAKQRMAYQDKHQE